MSGTKGARSRRFEGGLAPIAQAMNASVAFDRRLLPHDIAGSTAYSTACRLAYVVDEDPVIVA